MNQIRTKSVLVLGLSLGLCFVGGIACNGRGAKELAPESALPKELLDRDFLKSLSSQFDSSSRFGETAERIYPPEAPETAEARKLILWLLSLKDVKELEPLPPEEPDMYTIYLYKENRRAEFTLSVDGWKSRVRVSGFNGNVHLGREFECDTWIWNKIEEVFQKNLWSRPERSQK